MPESCCRPISPLGSPKSSVGNTKLWPSASPRGESWLGHTCSRGSEHAGGPPRDPGSSLSPPNPTSSHLLSPLLPQPPESLRFPALTALHSFLSPRSLSGICGTANRTVGAMWYKLINHFNWMCDTNQFLMLQASYITSHRAESSRRRQLLRWSSYSPYFPEPKGSILSSWKPGNCPYPQPD
jgi:hypothetical protein